MRVCKRLLPLGGARVCVGLPLWGCACCFIFFWVMGLLCVEGHLLSFMGSAGAELGLAAPV